MSKTQNPFVTDKDLSARLVQAFENMSMATFTIKDTLKAINDQNSLHHKDICEKIDKSEGRIEKVMNRYWFLVLLSFVVLAYLAGASGAFDFIPKLLPFL